MIFLESFKKVIAKQILEEEMKNLENKIKNIVSFYKSSRNEGSEFALFTETYASLM